MILWVKGHLDPTQQCRPPAPRCLQVRTGDSRLCGSLTPQPRAGDMACFSSRDGAGGKLAVEVVKERLKSVFGASEARIQPRSVRSRGVGVGGAAALGPAPHQAVHAVP